MEAIIEFHRVIFMEITNPLGVFIVIICHGDIESFFTLRGYLWLWWL